ncbi:hypothetical protein VT84_37020 [Gemmata sp. SH-PL17]|uniref:hypothetical protein n=1 Tax=Gemmata sp. SH-PL17 TaxID=1630693 RepID=UPI00078E4825|nr:hypothetical protein [Gemmata sp. SH-PL17]AMV30055.1 hypothetical protein VT84_37020 [Gemmata sp. SH-PL17]
MTKDDVLRAARGKPVPFEFDGFTCLLRPLSYGERQELFAWGREHAQEQGSGLALQGRLVLMALCDETGVALLEPTDLNQFGGPLVDAIALEITRRNGLDGQGSGEPGKGQSPTTPS